MHQMSVAPIHQAPIAPAQAAPLRLLILDDSEFDARRIKRALHTVDPSMVVSSVKSLTEYYRSILSERFDVLIIDYFLPDGDGLTALRMATDHANGNAFSTIMVAGENDPNVAEAAKGFGCSSYIPKSEINTDRLRQALNLTLAQTIENDLMAFRGLLEPSVGGALNDVEKNVIEPIKPYLMRLARASKVLSSLTQYRNDDILTQASIEIEHSVEAALAVLSRFDQIRNGDDH